MKKDKNKYKKSYESDGIMGKDKKTAGNKIDKKAEEPLFFNTTESSE